VDLVDTAFGDQRQEDSQCPACHIVETMTQTFPMADFDHFGLK
jgi:hypothetical protein